MTDHQSRRVTRFLYLLPCACALLFGFLGCGSGVRQAAATAATTAEVLAGYVAFGDSITAGSTLSAPATQAYPALVGNGLALPFSNYAIGGDQACDVFPRQVYAHAVGYSATPRLLYSLTIGTNDVDVKGTGAYQAVYRNCLNAALAWLGTRREDKLLAGDEGIIASGSCTDTSDSRRLGGITCSAGATGNVLATSLTTTGHAIYVWYSYRDDATVDDSFSVSVDETAIAVVNSAPAIAIATQNGSTASVGVLRVPVASGAHRVSITSSMGSVTILGIGSNRSASYAQLVVGDLPNQLVSDPVASTASQLLYSADIRAAVQQALDDGIPIAFALDRATMLGRADEMNDRLHPGALGQQHLAKAFLDALSH